MSFTRSVSVSFAAALCLSTALVMGGCSSKDEGPSATKSSPANPLGLKGPSEKTFAKHFAVPKRKVSDAEAQEALALLSLGESSTSGLSWDKTSGLDTEENVTVTMDSFSVARPSPAMARSIIEGLSNIKKIDDLDLDIDDEDMSFGAIGMRGVAMNSPEINLTAKTMMWGEDETTELSDFKIEDVNFEGTGEQGGAFSGRLGNLSAVGMNAKAFGDMNKKMRGSMGSPMGAMGSFNPLAKVYDTMAMDDFSFDSDFVSVEAKGFEGKATEKGGVTTIRQPKDASAKRAFDTIRSLEFDELVFQSSQTTVLDANKDTVELKDGLFTMKDGFKLSYNYGATGVKAMTDQMAERLWPANERCYGNAEIKRDAVAPRR